MPVYKEMEARVGKELIQAIYRNHFGSQVLIQNVFIHNKPTRR